MNHEHAVNLLKNGYIKEAIRLLKIAVQLNPNDQAAYVNLCIAQELLGQTDKAERGYRWILTRWPHNLEASSNLGNLFAQRGQFVEAAATYKQYPEDMYSLNALAMVQADQGNIEDCVDNLKRVAEKVNHPGAWSEYLSYHLHLGYDGTEHKRWVEKYAAPLYRPMPLVNYDGKRPIKVGYVSNTWDRHSVSAFILPILRSHSERVHVTLYSDISTPQFLKDEVNDYVCTATLNHFIFGAKIRKDGIDVLIDLDGHKTNSRLLAFASNPAPVMGTMNGYLPDTHLTENLNSGWSFASYDNAPEPASLPYDRNGYITFGSFHRPHKITRRVAEVWTEVIRRVDRSRLRVSVKGGETNTAVRHRLEEAGIAGDRLTLVPLIESTLDYLRSLGEIDIHLDSWPFNGVSITCDLLYQGVPTVTRRTEEAQGGVGDQLLGIVGLQDLVSFTDEEFVQTSERLAKDPKRLRRFRGSLREMMAPLLDATLLTRRLENTYHRLLSDPVRIKKARASEEQRLAAMRAKWFKMHTLALRGELTEQALNDILKDMTCQTCISHFRKIREPLPPDAEGQFALTVYWHNEINKILGKKTWAIEEAKQVYLEAFG